MRKTFNKIINVLSILIILSILFIPTTYVKAETLKDYKTILTKYQTEQKQNAQELNKTEIAIRNAQSEINKIKSELEKMSNELIQMQEDLVSYNNQIKEKSLQTKQLFEYLQVAQNENLYMEYAFEAETITDLIYRISVIKQLTEYNEETIKGLEKLVEENTAKQDEYAKKEEEMNVKQQQLSAKVTSLTGVKASLNENSVTVKEQIAIYEAIVKSYEDAGCRDNDIIGVDCAITSNVVGWYRPINSGYITSEAGYRWGSLHRGIDMSNKDPYNTKIYPVANGTIKAKYKDAYGALTVVIEHKTLSGQYYSSLYTHMSKYAPNIYVGKSVTMNDYIGYIGNTGYSFGPHLHLEVAPCRLFNQYDKNCSSWDKYTAYVKKLFNNGSFKGARSLIYFPKSGITFNGRL